MIFFVLLGALSWGLCQCFFWELTISLYVFFVLYLLFTTTGKKMVDRFQLNPMYYSFFSFFTKIILVIGFAASLIHFFALSRKTILSMLIVGYLIAAFFDFLLLMQSSENGKS